MAAQPAPTMRVVVRQGRKLYLAGQSQPLREGDVAPLPVAEAEALIAAGVVTAETPAAPAPAPAPMPTPAPAPEPKPAA